MAAGKKKSYKNYNKSKSLSKDTEKQVKKIVKKALDADTEDKYVVQQNDNFADITNGALNLPGISLISPLGTNQFTVPGAYNPTTDNHGMLGTEVRLKMLELNYTLSIPATASDGTCGTVRIMVISDNQPATDTSFTSNLVPYSAVANYDDILFRTGQLASSFYNFAKGSDRTNDRFTVLFDRLHTISLDDNGIQTFMNKVPLHGKKLKFSQTTALNTVYPLTSNILLFAICNMNSAITTIQWVYNTRVWYEDA